LRRRAFTLLEVTVGSGVLFLMVVMASMATTSYLRAYRHYTSEGAKLRVAAKTLETLCFELRSARSFEAFPKSLRQAPLNFENSGRQKCSLLLRGDQLWLQRDKESIRLGGAWDVQFLAHDGLLDIALPMAAQPALLTALSLRGMRRP